jgi:SnoaL-like polyketide cyclase
MIKAPQAKPSSTAQTPVSYRGEGRDVPWADPDLGGIYSQILFLRESPGPASSAGHGSGIISPDNNDQSVSYRQRKESVMSADENMELMQTLDDAWNARDWDTFAQRHKPDTVVRWPAQAPTHGVENHRAESIQLARTFPDNKVANQPYKVLFASGDWTCSISVGVQRDDDRPDGPGRRHGDPAYRQVIRGRLLHRRPLGQRPDRRGEPVL